MKDLITGLLTRTTGKLVFFSVVLIASVLMYLNVIHEVKYRTDEALDSYITVLKKDFSDRGYGYLKNGENFKAYMTLDSRYGNLKTYGLNAHIFKFRIYGSGYNVSFDKVGGDKFFGLNASRLDYKITDVFENGGYNLKVESVDCSGTLFFNPTNYCINKTFKIYWSKVESKIRPLNRRSSCL